MMVNVKGKDLNINNELAKRYCSVPLQEIDEEKCILWIENFYSKNTKEGYIRANINDLLNKKTENELSTAVNETLKRLVAFCGV